MNREAQVPDLDDELLIEIVEFYRESVANEMLAAIVMFGSDPAFDSLCYELAGFLGIRVSEAADLLWPITQKIYRGARAVANGV